MIARDRLDKTYRLQDLAPARARVQVWREDLLLADTTGALVSAAPESDGLLLVSMDDVTAGALAPSEPSATPGALSPAGASEVVGWTLRLDTGEIRVAFDPQETRIEMTDIRGPVDPLSVSNRFPRWGDLDDLVDQIDLLPVEPLAFDSRTYGDLRRNVVEGTQILAQAIVAASRAVPDQRVVSAHAIFSRPAGFDRPIRSTVDLRRRGRNFTTASVEASQDGKSIASALVLLDKGAADLIRSQAPMPSLPQPEDASPYDFGVSGRDVRFVNGDYGRDAAWVGPPEIHAWVRYRDAPDAIELQQGLLAQFTGHMTVAASLLPHEGLCEDMAHVSISTAILSVTIAFHDEPDLSDWLLYTNPVIHAGSGLAQGDGRIFTRGGRLLASYSVQAMVRNFERDPSSLSAHDRLL